MTGHVDDVVEALVSAATAPNINRQVINVGSGVETSIHDLIGAIERVTNIRVDPIFNNTGPGGVQHMRADVTRAKELLSFTPRTSLLINPVPNHTFRISYNEAFRSPSVINNYLDATILVGAPLGGRTP